MISICYCANKKVFPLILLSVMSIVKHTSEAVTVYIATMDLSDVDPRFLSISEHQRVVLEEVLREKNPESRAILLDMETDYRRHLMGGKNERSYYTPYAMNRLLLDLLPLPDRLIYLDTDVMCCSDIAELWQTNVTDYEFAAVKDKEGSFFIRPTYCNTGVLVLNLKKIKETGLFARTRERVVEKKMIMPDQSALNALAKDKLILPRRFNEQRAIRTDTVLKHFCRSFKWYGPFFKLYNYKQDDRINLHEKLHIFCFDDLYEKYDILAKKYDLTL